MAWLSGWKFRKSITLSRASGAVIDYQMRLLVGESSGATGEDVDCNGHVLSTFNDLRFTTSDGQTPLDYWIESVSGVSPNRLATVWIKFDSIETGETTFYMYYGIIEKTSYALNAFSVIVTPDGTLWAGHMTDGTIRKSVDGGENWTTKYTFAVGSGYVMCVWRASNGYLFASRYNSDILIRSTDGGENWATCKTLSGTNNSMVWHMAEDDDGYIYAGQYGSGAIVGAYIYRSFDYGDNWTTIWDNPDGDKHIHFVAVDPYTNVLYASQGDNFPKFFKSSDHGDSWTTIGSGDALWQPTAIAFGDGYRLIGDDNASAPPVCIRKTINDVDFSIVYTPPITDDLVYWNGGSVNSAGLIVFASWTQGDNERATIIGTKDGGTTWVVFDLEPTGVGNRGFTCVSNPGSTGLLYIPRSVEGDLVSYLLNYPDGFSDSLSSIIDTMIKGDDGVEGNFTEAESGGGELSHSDEFYLMNLPAIADAAIAGYILPDWNFECRIDSFGTYEASINSVLMFALVNVAAVADLIGDATKVALRNFGIYRCDDDHSLYPNYFGIFYYDTSNVAHYWDGDEWTTVATYLDLSSGIVQLKIWSDGTNFYADILDTDGLSLLTAPATIPISDVRGFSNGKCIHWGEARTDTYDGSQSVDNFYVRQYLDPEPVWGSWGEEEYQYQPPVGGNFVIWIN